MTKIFIIFLILFSIESFACDENSVCKSDRVHFLSISGMNRVGKVVEVFSNGKVKIDSDYSPHWEYRHISEVAKGVNCFKGLCIGDRLHFLSESSNNRVGKAIEIFNDGTIKIDSDYSPHWEYRNISKVAKGVNCNKRICKGDRIQFFSSDGSHHSGKVNEVFTNEMLKIDSDYSKFWKYRLLKDVGKSFRCVESTCVGDRVIYNNHTGSVVELYDNGNVKIDSDYSSYFVYKNQKQLGLGVECTINADKTSSTCSCYN